MDAHLADLVVAVHLGVVLFVIGGLVLILVGGVRRWDWVRNPWFRGVHTAIMGYVVLNAVRGASCFLTDWEYALRARAGQAYDETGSFVGRIARELLYLDLPEDSIALLHIAFGVVVAISFVAVRPRWRAKRS